MHSNETIPGDRVILSTRTLDFPRELVFRAWSEPAHLAVWWGPAGFTNTFHEFDQRPGGDWRFTMHGPDGHNYENHSVFREVEPCARITFDHLSNPRFHTIVLFEEPAAGRTRIVWRMIFETAEIRAAVQARVGEANEENFDRLAAELARMSAAAS